MEPNVRVSVDMLRDLTRAKIRIRAAWSGHDGTDRALILDGYLLAIMDVLEILDAKPSGGAT